MELTAEYAERTRAIIALFRSAFTASEGATEGDLIAELAAGMPTEDIFVVSALDASTQVGAIIFTKLTYPEDPSTVFLLSPAAVATAQQGKRVGQNLINYGLSQLHDRGVDIVLTYGDINFYSKVGFAQITEDIARPPLPLAYPEGWLGQSLTGHKLSPLNGPSRCVEPLNDAVYW